MVLLRTLGDGLRVLARHWPTLLLLFFLGKAASGALLWVAIAGSKLSPLLGMLLLPGASIAMLIAIVLMLRVVVPSLPALRGSLHTEARGERIRSDLRLAVHVLIPFLAVYASQGMMKEDLRTYVHSGTADEWLNQGFAADFSRVSFGTEAQILSLVVVALVLRKVIAGFDLSSRHPGIAGIAGYLEALWLVTLAAYFTSSLGDLRAWVMSRAAIDWVQQGLGFLVELFGPVGAFFDFLASQVMSVVSAMGALVVVPVSWIAVGATIYGASLPAAKPLLTSEEMTRRIKRIPNPVRRAVSQVTEPVVGPVANTLKAIGRIAVAGAVPMVLLCVLFAGTSQLRVLTVDLLRALIGPQAPSFWIAFTPHIDLVAQAVYITVMVGLLAASVNSVVASQRRLKDQQERQSASAAPAESAPGSASE